MVDLGNNDAVSYAQVYRHELFSWSDKWCSRQKDPQSQKFEPTPRLSSTGPLTMTMASTQRYMTSSDVLHGLIGITLSTVSLAISPGNGGGILQSRTRSANEPAKGYQYPM